MSGARRDGRYIPFSECVIREFAIQEPARQATHEVALAMLAATPDCVNILSAEGVLLCMNVRGVELHELSSIDDVIGLNDEAMWPDREP